MAETAETVAVTVIAVVRFDDFPQRMGTVLDALRRATDYAGDVLVADASPYAQYTAEILKAAPVGATMFTLAKPVFGGGGGAEERLGRLPRIGEGVVLLPGSPLIACLAGQMATLVTGGEGDALFEIGASQFKGTAKALAQLARRLRVKYVLVDLVYPETAFSWSIAMCSTFSLFLPLGGRPALTAISGLWDAWGKVAKKAGVVPGGYCVADGLDSEAVVQCLRFKLAQKL